MIIEISAKGFGYYNADRLVTYLKRKGGEVINHKSGFVKSQDGPGGYYWYEWTVRVPSEVGKEISPYKGEREASSNSIFGTVGYDTFEFSVIPEIVEVHKGDKMEFHFDDGARIILKPNGIETESGTDVNFYAPALRKYFIDNFDPVGLIPAAALEALIEGRIPVLNGTGAEFVVKNGKFFIKLSTCGREYNLIKETEKQGLEELARKLPSFEVEYDYCFGIVVPHLLIEAPPLRWGDREFWEKLDTTIGEYREIIANTVDRIMTEYFKNKWGL